MKKARLVFASCLCLRLCSFTALFAQTQSDSQLVSNPVFQENCVKCHGKTAEGRHFGGPSLKTQKVASASADDLRSVIANGKGHMPKYSQKLTSAQIDTLVGQIQALK